MDVYTLNLGCVTKWYSICVHSLLTKMPMEIDTDDMDWDIDNDIMEWNVM